jgi:hypothetical protein
MWFSALKLGLNAATHIYKKKQETKMKMADAQLTYMQISMARGESELTKENYLRPDNRTGKTSSFSIVLTLPDFSDCVRGLLGRSGCSSIR